MPNKARYKTANFTCSIRERYTNIEKYTEKPYNKLNFSKSPGLFVATVPTVIGQCPFQLNR